MTFQLLLLLFLIRMETSRGSKSAPKVGSPEALEFRPGARFASPGEPEEAAPAPDAGEEPSDGPPAAFLTPQPESVSGEQIFFAKQFKKSATSLQASQKVCVSRSIAKQVARQ